MAKVATQSSDQAQQVREQERIRAAQQAQAQRPAQKTPPPKPPEAKNPNLGNRLDVTA